MRRETFYEAQRRHRRSGWRFAVAATVAVVLVGLPLSAVVSPFLSAVALITVDVVDLVVPMPDPVADIDRFLERLTEEEGPGSGGTSSYPGREVATVAVALLVPGMLLMALTALCMRRVFLRAGAGAVVLAAGARPPDGRDVEERQLVNLVEEMAIAAGVRPPRVMILDEEMGNAAVVGNSVDDATLLVPRRLLSDLGRRPTGAIVADLLASIVNGDLRIALGIASVFQTFDLVGAVLGAPLSRRTRQVLRQFVRLALRPRSRPTDGVEAHFIAVELAALARLADEDDDSAEAGCVTLALQFPFLVASIAYSMNRMILGGTFVTPVLAALWRRRRLLADATAVELTRDPDALAGALEYLEEHGSTVPAGPWTHLFVVGPEVADGQAERRFERRRKESLGSERRPGESNVAALRRRTRSARAAQSDYQRELTSKPAGAGKDDGSDELRSFLPKIDKRLERLGAMGANVAPRPTKSQQFSKKPLDIAWYCTIALVCIPLIFVLAVLMLGCLALMIYLALLFEMALLAPVVAVVHVLLR